MLYRTVPKTGDKLSILGFGCMRYPSKGRGIDEERTIRQIRHAIDNGVNYFDTAPVYHMGKSEPILAKALADGYREKVRIATKLPHWSVVDPGGHGPDPERPARNPADRSYRLLPPPHSQQGLRSGACSARCPRISRCGKERRPDQKCRVLVPCTMRRNLRRSSMPIPGISARSSIITWMRQNQAGTEGLKYAASKGLAVIIMEPLRGGNLAGRVPESVQKIWDGAPVKRSPAEWALRWVWNHPEVTVVLSGMNEEAHIDENLRVAGQHSRAPTSRPNPSSPGRTPQALPSLATPRPSHSPSTPTAPAPRLPPEAPSPETPWPPSRAWPPTPPPTTPRSAPFTSRPRTEPAPHARVPSP